MDQIGASGFTCEGKVIGGYYADVDSRCQMFHVCTLGQEGDNKKKFKLMIAIKSVWLMIVLLFTRRNKGHQIPLFKWDHLRPRDEGISSISNRLFCVFI